MASYNSSQWVHGDDVGYGHWYQDTPNGTLVCSNEDNIAWLKYKGTDAEMLGANVCMWMAFAACLLCLMFYAYSTWRATCGWEEVYVCLVEMVKVMIEVFHENDSPATLYLSTGNFIMWIRYGEWLLSCPVILIHLSNITGLQDQYSKRTMQLLVSDLGTITMGVTAALCSNYVKWIFFIAGLCYGVNTYFHAAKVYIESYHIVPKGICRICVRVMAWCFFAAWTCYPLLFVFGPEGLGVLSYNASAIGHTIIDIFSKQVWGFVGHYLRIKIHEHIVIHGNLVKPTKVKVAGMEIDAEEMVEKDEEGAIDKGTKELAHRESFLVMRDRLQKQGVETRGSFERPDESKGDKLGTAVVMLEPGRVILSVPDPSMVDFFRQQFAQLPAPIELVPALGPENTVALAQQAMNMGGLDCVLLHPEFLRDRSPAGLVLRLKQAGHRVAAFGWSPNGPVRDMIESSGLDGFLEGPSFGAGINMQQLLELLSRAQQLRKMAMYNMMGMGGMGMGGMGNNGMGTMGRNGMISNSGNIMGPGTGNSMGMGMGGMQNGMGGMQNGMGSMYNGMGNMQNGMGSMQNGMGPVNTNSMTASMGANTMSPKQMSANLTTNMNMAGGMGMGGMNPGSAMPASLPNGILGNNPLYNANTSPMGSQINMGNMGQNGMGMSNTPGTVTPPTPAGNPAVGTSEAEMLQQLMAEINRLKNELGEH